MKKAPKFTAVERDELQILHEKGYSARAIAKALGRSPNTIAAELKRNSYGCGGRTPPDKRGTYSAGYANVRAYNRRRAAKYQGKKIQENDALRAYIVAGLKAGWNPDEISGSMRTSGQPFYASKTTIYEWLYSEWGQAYCQYLHSRQARPCKRKPKQPKRVLIPSRVSVELRPQGATNRTRYGHWEGDAVVSGRAGKAALAVFQERKTRLIRASLIPDLRTATFATAAIHSLAGHKTLSLTLDNGVENYKHQDITAATGTKAFFCDPYSSWQKGGVENANKLLRDYLPKGCDLGQFDQAFVDAACDRLNKKPRKVLGYKSALQLAVEKGVISPGTER